MFPLVRNLSKKLLRFHYPTWLHTNPFFRSSFPRPLIVQESIKATGTNKYLPFGKKTTSGHHKFLYRNQLLGPEKEKREREREREMAATSGAVLNGLGSSFLCGGKRSRALSGIGATGIGSCSVGARKLTIVAAAQPKKSWIPAVKGGGSFVDPEWLDGSLPGDYGFDPLGLGKDPAFLKWYREAELIHGRWAMAAVVGIFVGQAWSGIPWFEAGADPGAIAPFSFGSLLGTQLILMGWVESKRWVDFFNPESQSVEWATPWSKTAENFANATGDQGYPGGKFFDPLSFAGTLKNGVYIPDEEKLERLKLAEIKHARLAMIAMLIFYFEAGQGKTPLGALGL